MSYTKIRSIVFCIVLFVLGLKVSGKGKDHFSIEVDVNYFHYYFSGNSVNNFNYGFSLLGSKYMHRLKVSSGINYSTRYYENPGSAFHFEKKLDYSIDYLNIPVILNFGIISLESFRFSIITGLLLTYVIEHRIDIHYLNNEITPKNIDVKAAGSTLSYGINLSWAMNNKFSFNLSPSGYYIINPYHDYNPRNHYRTISVNRVYTGIKLGIEYSIN